MLVHSACVRGIKLPRNRLAFLNSVQWRNAEINFFFLLQTARSRPKRGGTETPDDDKSKTPSKNAPSSNASSPDVKGSSTTGGVPNTPAAPATPQAKKKAAASKADTPTKGKKRQQDMKEEIAEGEERELGLFKKKRDRPEVKSYSCFKTMQLVMILIVFWLYLIRIALIWPKYNQLIKC